MQGARVWSLVGELRSHMLCGAAKKKKKKKRKKKLEGELAGSKALRKKNVHPTI